MEEQGKQRGLALVFHPVAFTYGGVDVTLDENRLVSLNDIWSAFGSIQGRDPRRWLRLDTTKRFAEFLAKSLNVQKMDIQKTIRGGSGNGRGGSWAHWKMAVAYAEYVSDEAHAHVIEAFKEWTEEKADPGLKAERAIKEYERRGYDHEWIQERFRGIVNRNALTSTMKDHNCKPIGHDNPYAEGTRSISLAVLGQTPKEIRAEKGLTKRSARTRDHLELHELAAISLAEILARKLMKDESLDGNFECVDACKRSGKVVGNALNSLQEPQKRPEQRR